MTDNPTTPEVAERARVTDEMVEAGLQAFNNYNRDALEFFEDRHVKELVRDVLRAALAAQEGTDR